MKINKLTLEKFKKVEKVDLDLQALNVLVGGNNSGKSSVLQGVHFSIIAAVASREAGRDTYTQESLLYCPSHNFESLRHGSGYLNQSNFGWLKLHGSLNEELETEYKIKIYRGRNEGNVGCQRFGSPRFGQIVTSSENPFSIYVPGLAGIPQNEQFRTESVVRRGVAGGDANLYLRNVIWWIKEKNLLPELNVRMQSLFQQFYMEINFDQTKDIYFDVQISTTGVHGRKCPLELIGTGVLQALQIFSYVTLFKPKLLLLDEPDSHLHPDNQVLLARVLQLIASETTTQVLIATHSRHIVEALYDEANFVWLKDGKVFKQGIGLDRLPLLLDIGALDRFDKLMAGQIKWVVLTEDINTKMMETLVMNSGYNKQDTLFFSYKTSSNLEAAIILSSFILEISPDTKVIIHRDKDFMTDEESLKIADKIKDVGAIPFITEGSDIESYYLNPEHLAMRIGVDVVDIENWLSDIARENHMSLQHYFTRKRDEVKNLLYRKNPQDCPDTMTLLGAIIPLPCEKRLGKDMLAKVKGQMHSKFGKTVDVLTPTTNLKSTYLTGLHV